MCFLWRRQLQNKRFVFRMRFPGALHHQATGAASGNVAPRECSRNAEHRGHCCPAASFDSRSAGRDSKIFLAPNWARCRPCRPRCPAYPLLCWASDRVQPWHEPSDTRGVGIVFFARSELLDSLALSPLRRKVGGDGQPRQQKAWPFDLLGGFKVAELWHLWIDHAEVSCGSEDGLHRGVVV